MIEIRPFEPTDEEYEAVVAVWNAVWPDDLYTVEEMRHDDETRNPERLFQRLVAVEEDGTIPAFAMYQESGWDHVPGKYRIRIYVHPERRRQGIGTRLYEHVIDALAARDPIKLESGTREHQAGGLAMLEKYGFKQVMREPVSHLDVAAFDPTPFQAKRERVEASGIVIRPLTALRDEVADWARRLYDLDWECIRDMPSPDPPTRHPFDVWSAQQLEAPGFLPEATFVALDGERWVALSQLWSSAADPSKLYQGVTGVVRSHRRQGLATVLKLHTIEFARAYGATVIETDNEENNPMFQINLQLGFVPQPAHLEFARPWDGGNGMME